MVYQLETASQLYGDDLYLAHNLVGQAEGENRKLFAQRVPSYGIINFGTIPANGTKSFKPINGGIQSDILLRSIYDFTNTGTADEVTLKLFNGQTQILEQKMTSAEMPYLFPDGAIVNPNLTIQVTPRYDTTQLLIYWQPVHVLSYLEV